MTVFKTARIAPYQLISVYILCRAGVFMSFQNQENPLEGFPAVFTSLFSELLIPLLLLPGLLLLRRYPEDTIVHCGYRLCGKWIGALFGGLYLIFFLLTLGIGISQFQLFSSFHLYEEPSGGLILFSAAAIAFLCSLKGIEPVARVAFPAAVWLGISFSITIVLGLFRSDPVQLTPLSFEQTSDISQALCQQTGEISDGVLLLMLLPSLTKKNASAYWGGPLVCGFAAFFRRFVEFGMLGSLAMAGVYPFFTVTRSTGLFVISWLLAGLVRFSAYFCMCNQLLYLIFPEPARKPASFLSAAGVIALGFWFTGNQKLFLQIQNLFQTGLPLLLLGTILPTFLLILSQFQKTGVKFSQKEGAEI